MDVGKLGSNIINSYDVNKQLKVPEPINQNGPMEVSTYMGLLQKKFSGYQVGTGVIACGSIPAGNRTITIAPNVLKAMAEDPEVAVKYEGFLTDCTKLEAQFNQLHAACGREVVASGIFINPDGTTGGYTVTQTKGGGDDKKTSLRSLDDILEKAKQRHAEYVKQQKEIKETRALKNQVESHDKANGEVDTGIHSFLDVMQTNRIDWYT